MEIIERKNVLENVIAYFTQQGYRVVSKSDTTVQLVKPKQFSCLAAIIFALIFYLLYYLSKKDKTLYIVINEEGKINITDEFGQVRIVDNVGQISNSGIQLASAENDPGYTKSTKIILVILAIFIIAFIIYMVINSLN